MTIAFPILPNEIEGFVQFLEEKAVLIGKRTFKVSHDKITRYLIGDNKESKNDKVQTRQRNRVRFKFASVLKDKHNIKVEFKGYDGYVFTFPDSFEVTSNEQVKETLLGPNGERKEETYSKYKTDFHPPYWFSRLIRALKFNRYPILIGPKGTGKSRSLEEAFSILGIKHIRVSMGQIADPSILFGQTEIEVEEGNSITRYEKGFIPLCADLGWALILDEIDTAHPDIVTTMNTCLEADGRIILRTEKGFEEVKKQPGFFITATANSWGYGEQTMDYAGTKPQNRATFDRFSPKFPVNFDYDIIKKILNDKLPPVVLEALLKKDGTEAHHRGIFVKIQDSIASGIINDDMGMRPMIRFVEDFNIFGWHIASFFLLQEFNPMYRDAVSTIITDHLSSDFKPSDNDYNPEGDDYIQTLETETNRQGFIPLDQIASQGFSI